MFIVDPLSLEWLLDISTLAQRCRRAPGDPLSCPSLSSHPPRFREGRRPLHLQCLRSAGAGAHLVDRDLTPAGSIADAAEHAFAAEVHDDAARAVDGDETAFAA